MASSRAGSRRPDLFTSRTNPKTARSIGPLPSGRSYGGPQQQSSSARLNVEQNSEAVDDCMELEHVFGYSGRYPKTLQFHPTQPNIIVYNIGSVIVVGDLTDPHKQRFLQGHDADVTSIDISPDGRFIASGQLGSKVHAGDAAPVIIWDFYNMSNIYVFEGMKHKISSVAFSPDSKFVSATSNENCAIWDMEVGELVVSRAFVKPIAIMSWGRTTVNPRTQRSIYQINFGCTTDVIVCSLIYDVGAVRYVLKTNKCTLPTSGLTRKYFCSAIDSSGTCLLAGTSNGEFAVFNTEHFVYRTSVPISSNGVTALLTFGEKLFVGSGDGVLKQLSGFDMEWIIERQVQLIGRITAISADASTNTLAVSSDQGKIWSVDLETFTAKNISTSHIDGVNCITFVQSLDPKVRPHSDLLCTGSRDGTIKVWELSHYQCVTSISLKKRVEVYVLFFFQF